MKTLIEDDTPKLTLEEIVNAQYWLALLSYRQVEQTNLLHTYDKTPEQRALEKALELERSLKIQERWGITEYYDDLLSDLPFTEEELKSFLVKGPMDI